MPYEINQIANGKYSVINPESNTVHAKETTLKKAKSQVRLLHALDHGWKPFKGYNEVVKMKKGDLIKEHKKLLDVLKHPTKSKLEKEYNDQKKEMKKYLDVDKQMPKRTSKWIEYVRTHMKNKKFKSRTEVNNYMKTLAKQWKEGK